MAKGTIHPDMARDLLGEREALVGAGKIVFTDNSDASLFAGFVKPPLGAGPVWHMAAGTLIFVPLKRFVGRSSIEGWRIEDIISGGEARGDEGLDPRHWREL